jgi:ubiquitin-conjugating enzyme E2 D/E
MSSVVSSVPKSHKRLIKEFGGFSSSPLSSVCSVSLVHQEDYSSWLIRLSGPESTPYAGGIFTLSFSFPSSYPLKPPEVHFITPIYHPNVSMESGGMICHDALFKDWSPTVHFTAIIERLISLLASPAEDSPLEPQILEVWKTNRKKFDETAANWTKKHASKK